MPETKPQYIISLTESGDLYAGTKAAWDRYHGARDSGNYDLIYSMEEGSDPEFRYAPEGTYGE